LVSFGFVKWTDVCPNNIFVPTIFDIKQQAGENGDRRSCVRQYAVSYIIRTARVVTSAMETKINKMFYAKVRDNIWIARPNLYLNHAAMVFEEAARLSYQLRQLWPQASALTPKVPAPLWLSHQNAQTHRLPNQQMSSYLSHVRKNEFEYGTAFISEDVIF